ncbi:SDR family oxidoreductase [Mesorhizobium sp. M4A.F.Ca.ET.050.02.1.1]|nr:SDR family oxidoreductase [Mesorhizobium sp. M4A.F.Ca.ET.050.02.1.1]
MTSVNVLVTGVSAGIGGAICEQLANTHGKALSLVMCVRRSTELVEDLASACRLRGSAVVIVTADLSQPPAPAELVAKAVEEFGGLDAIVSNAGIADPAPLESLELDAWDRMFAITCRASWLLAKAAFTHLCDSRGSFVSISSQSGSHPHRGTGAYSSAKAALTMLCRQLAIEWGQYGIRVNCVSPGMIRTPMTEAVYQDEGMLRAREAIVPLGAIGQPSDVARLVEFLIDPTNRYVTGQNIGIDGGLSQTLLDRIPGLARRK